VVVGTAGTSDEELATGAGGGTLVVVGGAGGGGVVVVTGAAGGALEVVTGGAGAGELEVKQTFWKGAS
jgi:hypothetical protein